MFSSPEGGGVPAHSPTGNSNDQWPPPPLDTTGLLIDVDEDEGTKAGLAGLMVGWPAVAAATLLVGGLALIVGLMAMGSGDGGLTESVPGQLAGDDAPTEADLLPEGSDDIEQSEPSADTNTAVGAAEIVDDATSEQTAGEGETAAAADTEATTTTAAPVSDTVADNTATTPLVVSTTTAAPTTAAPTTAAPTTAAPTTAAPTTAAPTTAAPTTAAPTTAAPTTAAPTTAPPTTTGGGDTLTAFRQELLRLTNVERAKVGCPALALHPTLNQVAQAHSEDMIARNYFAHASPDGDRAGQRMTEAGYPWKRWGENIAYGYPTPANVMNGWMNSTSHRDNILDCNFLEMGAGYANPNHYWTQVFGTR